MVAEGELDEERTLKAMKTREQSEADFSEWLHSIKFIDKDGNVVEYDELPEDDSPDPEGDRGEE